MATIDNLKINVTQVETSVARRKIQHELYGVDGAILEDTGQSLKIYTVTVQCTGRDWELKRDELVAKLSTNQPIWFYHVDTDYQNVEVVGYSVDESSLQRGLATFEIELIESLDVRDSLIFSLNDELDLLEKIKAIYGVYSDVMDEARRFKGLIAEALSNVTKIVTDVLDIPGEIYDFVTDPGPFNLLMHSLKRLDKYQLSELTGRKLFTARPFLGGSGNSVVDVQIAEYNEEGLRVEVLIHAVIHIRTLEVLSEKETFATLGEALLFHKQVNKNYIEILSRLDPTEEFVKLHTAYLTQWERDKVNLKSFHYFDTHNALLPDLFVIAPYVSFDSLFPIQNINLVDLFVNDTLPRQLVYIK